MLEEPNPIEDDHDQDAQGNVIVVLRFRPLNEKEKLMSE